MSGKIVEFHWITSYKITYGNISSPLDSLIRCIHEKIMLTYMMDLSNKSRDKSLTNIARDWKELHHRPCKEAVANFTSYVPKVSLMTWSRQSKPPAMRSQ
ncbi:hypothetical protein NPIL_500791 [Nephila pilipes]|uniref:Uncharacterized protein n=1 Tax=Nephila pilipes TaxID=299642 RepID=A0A8X6MAY9_NEPPI|nr:hypothetical protein NPIL_500791 [Nephila pilipes]